MKMSIFPQELTDFSDCSSLHPHLAVIEAKIILRAEVNVLLLADLNQQQ